MTRATWDLTRWLSLTVLIVGAGAAVFAQTGPAATGALSGRLTDVHSVPLSGVVVILRNQATGAETHATTARNGAYRFAALAPGAYSLEADSERLGRGTLEDIVVAAGHEARVQAAIELTPMPALAALPFRLGPRVDLAPGPPALIAALAPQSISNQLLPSRIIPAPVWLPLESPRITASVTEKRIEPLQLEARNMPLPMPAALHPELALAVVATPASLDVAALQQFAPATATIAPLPNLAQNAAAQPEPAAEAVTTTVNAAELQALPASGRRWQEFLLDTPAAASSPGGSQLSLRGAGQEQADATIDGASVRLAFGGAAGAGSQSGDTYTSGQAERGGAALGRGSYRGFAVSEAAVREVRIVAGNVEAAGSHAAGGRIGVTTRSGSNDLHGQSFLFDRQNTWGARNPFTTWVKETLPSTSDSIPTFTAEPYTPPDHEISWGLGAGGRIRRDRLFWFAALDGYRRNDPGLAEVKHADEFFAQPSTGQMQLLCAQLRLSVPNPMGGLSSCPTAEVTSDYSQILEQLADLLGPAPRTASQWMGFGRLDWQATERNRFALEGTGADWNAPGGGMTRVSEPYGSHSFGTSEASQQWLLARWETFLTPNLLAVTQASAGREVLTAQPGEPSDFERKFLDSGWNPYGQLPQIVVDSSYGFTIGSPSRFGQGSYPDEHLYHAQEMLDWVHDRLILKAGFELDHNTDSTTLLRNQAGTYHYSTIEKFVTDALVFEKFGLDASTPASQYNCNPAGSSLGALPCYSYYSQMMGPNVWLLSTNDLAGYTTAQWQLNKFTVLSAGLRWEREQPPPPMKLVANPGLPLAGKLPALGNQWGPRMSLAVGNLGRWPVLRLGYGMYYGRTENATLETVLTQTGSMKGDLYFFIRPTDGYTSATGTSSAPLFPNVLSGTPASVVTPSAVEYEKSFRNPEIHQAVASIEQEIPGHVYLTASAMLSLGRRLPVSIDTNIDPALNPQTITYAVKDATGMGPIKKSQITVPYYALWPARDCPAGSLANIAGRCGRLNPQYQQVAQIESRANSTYEAAVVRFSRYARNGLSLHAHYTYAHAMDWNPNESTYAPGSNVLDPENFSQEYGTSNLDVRHSAAAMMIYETPWKLRGRTANFANGWMLSGVAQFRSGLPYTMRVTGSIPEEYDIYGDPAVTGLGPGMNGSGGDSRVYGVGRNTFRYPQAWKADARLGKKFYLGERREFELMAESFNLFNHRNVTELETTGYEIENSSSTGPSLCYLVIKSNGFDSCATPTLANPGPFPAAFGTPLNINATNFYRERQIEFGARMRF